MLSATGVAPALDARAGWGRDRAERSQKTGGGDSMLGTAAWVSRRMRQSGCARSVRRPFSRKLDVPNATVPAHKVRLGAAGLVHPEKGKCRTIAGSGHVRIPATPATGVIVPRERVGAGRLSDDAVFVGAPHAAGLGSGGRPCVGSEHRVAIQLEPSSRRGGSQRMQPGRRDSDSIAARAHKRRAPLARSGTGRACSRRVALGNREPGVHPPPTATAAPECCRPCCTPAPDSADSRPRSDGPFAVPDQRSLWPPSAATAARYSIAARSTWNVP